MTRRSPTRLRTVCSAAAIGVIVLLTVLPGGAGAATSTTTPGSTTAGGTTPGKVAQIDKYPGLTDLASCIKDTNRLSVMLLMDQSASLQKTDPNNIRVAAASSAVGGLATLSVPTILGGKQITKPVRVEVQLAAFSNAYYGIGGWQPLTVTTLPAIQKQIQDFAKRNVGEDTDFPSALIGATRVLNQHTADLTADGSAAPCRAVLLFTDGQYDIGVRTPEKLKTLERFKSYAPKADLTTQAGANEAGKEGVDALCRQGGIAEDARKKTSIIAVPLTTSINKQALGLLESMAVGFSSAQGGCGKDVGQPRGAFLPAGNLTTLLERFDQVAVQIGGGTVVQRPDSLPLCQKTSCDTVASFTVDASVNRVHLLTVIPRVGTRTEIVLPGVSTPLTYTNGTLSSPTVGSSQARVTRLSATADTVDITLGATPAEWQGQWKLRFVNPADAPEPNPGYFQVSLFSRIGVILDGHPLLRSGETDTLHVSLAGTGVKDALVAHAQLSASLTDPGTGVVRRADLVPDPAGGYTVAFTLPIDIRSAQMRAQFSGTVTTTGGVDLQVNGGGLGVTVLKPAVFPQIAPPVLLLSPIDGIGSTSGVVYVSTGLLGSGCLGFPTPRFLGTPPASQPVSMTVIPPPGNCMKVPDGLTKPRLVTVKFSVGHRANGTIRGVLTVVHHSTRDPRVLYTDIPFTFEVRRGIDRSTQVRSAVALMAIGTLLPLLGLIVMNFFSTRFQSVSFVRATSVPVVVSEGAVFRPNPKTGKNDPLNLYPADFQKIEGVDATNRKFTWSGLDFVARPNPNPFGEGWAEVAPSEGPAKLETREGTRVDLDLGLSGSWFFVYDPDMTLIATRTIKAKGGVIGDYPPEIHGRLIAFVADGPMRAQLSRLVPTILGKLPTTAARMVDLVRGKKAVKRRGATPARPIPTRMSTGPQPSTMKSGREDAAGATGGAPHADDATDAEQADTGATTAGASGDEGATTEPTTADGTVAAPDTGEAAPIVGFGSGAAPPPADLPPVAPANGGSGSDGPIVGFTGGGAVTPGPVADGDDTDAAQ